MPAVRLISLLHPPWRSRLYHVLIPAFESSRRDEPSRPANFLPIPKFTSITYRRRSGRHAAAGDHHPKAAPWTAHGRRTRLPSSTTREGKGSNPSSPCDDKLPHVRISSSTFGTFLQQFYILVATHRRLPLRAGCLATSVVVEVVAFSPAPRRAPPSRRASSSFPTTSPSSLSCRMGNKVGLGVALMVALSVCLLPFVASAQLRRDYYAKTCPGVESIVRKAVQTKFQQTFITAPGTLRLFFHDCIINGCDASIIVASTERNKAEKDHPDNLSLAGDGFDTVIKAKAAVDAVPQCRNKVSCADILAMAARDVVALAGGPSYAVELGRKDSLSSTAASVNGKLPQPTFNLDQLTAMFAAQGLSRTDMIALSAAHTLGFSHCDKFSGRIHGFSPRSAVDPTLNRSYAGQLRGMCPRGVDPRVAVDMDPVTPRTFDNMYYRNLQRGMGLFASDQVLHTDRRSRPTVDAWAGSNRAFEQAFVSAMTKLGRVGVKTGSQGNVRRDCGVLD